jgi:hypothetical protein
MFLSYSQRECLVRLAKDKGHVPCYSCGSQSVGLHEYASNWSLGGQFRVILKCPDCYAEDDFYISEEEARGCGLDPAANLPDTP